MAQVKYKSSVSREKGRNRRIISSTGSGSSNGGGAFLGGGLNIPGLPEATDWVDKFIVIDKEGSNSAEKTPYILPLPKSTFESMFELVDNNGTQYIRAKYSFASVGTLQAFETGGHDIPGIWDSMPMASADVLGGIKIGTNLSIDPNGVLHAEAGGVSSWNDLTDKPSSFVPSAHNHVIADVTGLQTALEDKEPAFTKNTGFNLPKSDSVTSTSNLYLATTKAVKTAYDKANHAHPYRGDTWVPAWSEITNKPTTFASTIALVSGLQDALDGKAATHSHPYEPTFSKNTAFNKNFGSSSGTVAQGNDYRITRGNTAYGWGNHASAGYQTLANFASMFELKGSGDNQYIEAKYNFYSVGAVAAYVAGDPGSTIWDSMPIATTTKLGGIKIGANLSIDANGVVSAQASGVSSWNDLTDKPSTFTPSSHTHSIANVLGLQSALDGKAANSHSHSGYLSTTGTAAKVLVSNHTTNSTKYPVVWHNNSNTLYDSVDRFTFTPSTGTLEVTRVWGAIGSFSDQLQATNLLTGTEDGQGLDIGGGGDLWKIYVASTSNQQWGGYMSTSIGAHTYFLNATQYGSWVFKNPITTPQYGGAVAEVTFEGNMRLRGMIQASNTSDMRLKENLSPLTNSIGILNKVKVYGFNYNDKAVELMQLNTKEYDTGVIAQELQDIPELKHIIKPIYDNYLGVRYEQLIPHIIGAIQEQSTKLELLEKENLHLQEQLNAITNGAT